MYSGSVDQDDIAGCGWTLDRVAALLGDDPQTLAMWRKAVTPTKGTNQHTREHADNIRTQRDGHGTGKAYTLDRLQRERPDLFKRVVDGELSTNGAEADGGQTRTMRRKRVNALTHKRALRMEFSNNVAPLRKPVQKMD